jgi:benzoate/toluate 1,2-dioxygenase alpha subunit
MDLENISLYVDDRPEEGVFRVHRDVYADPQLFELEMKFIFERTWVFLALESQIPKPHDFVTTHIARTPVLVTRDAAGKVGAFINVCRHKGATVCRSELGNTKYHVCAYHGWGYDSAGKNIDIKDRKTGAYPASFDQENHDLLRIDSLASHKGMVFGSLSADVPPLTDFLGDMRVFLDLVMEQGPQGMEFVPGRSAYVYRGNWKLQMDNGLDAYHLTSTHTSYMDIQARRRMGEGHQEARQYDWAKRAAIETGVFAFDNGHAAFWLNQAEPTKRPIYPTLEEIRARVGNQRAEWMIKGRNIEVFPNLQIADSITLMLRTFRPLSVDRTEMRAYCLAPVGERADLRAWRLRQFEDFFNPSGMATPDDTVLYEECQNGFAAPQMSFLQGIRPAMSSRGPFELFNEVGLHSPYREWARLMEAGMAGRGAYP